MVRGADNPIFREGIASAGKRWREEGRGAGARLIPEKFALHSGRIGRATERDARRVPEVEIKKERRWSSDSSQLYVRPNVENPVWVPGVLENEAGELERQPGQGARWGGMGKVPPCPVTYRPLGALLFERKRSVQISGRRGGEIAVSCGEASH